MPPPRYHIVPAFNHNTDVPPSNLKQAKGQLQPQHADSAILSTINHTIQVPEDFFGCADNLLDEIVSPMHHEKENTYLKRPGSSSLNVPAHLAPEILGHIFWCEVVSNVNCNIRWVYMNTFKFLLVCHHWFNVATSTPSLWAFWEIPLSECTKYSHISRDVPLYIKTFHHYSGNTPLYINIKPTNPNSDQEVMDASNILQDWGVQKRICDLHIHTSAEVLAKIITFMSMPQPSPIQSQIKSLKFIAERLWNNKFHKEFPDITNFLKAHSLPGLQCLHLDDCDPGWKYLICQTSRLTHLHIIINEGSIGPTMTQLAALFTRNSALEEVCLSFDIAMAPEDSLSKRQIPTSIFLPHIHRLEVGGEAAGYVQLLNHLIFSNRLEEVILHLWLNKTKIDVAEGLAPFLYNLFQMHHQKKLAVCISCIYQGFGIEVLQHSEEIVARKFLSIYIYFHSQSFILPNTLEGVVKSIPTARITSLSIKDCSTKCRHNYWQLLPTISAVEKLCITKSTVGDIFYILASPPTRDGVEPVFLPHLHTLQLTEISFKHPGAALGLSNLLKQRHQAGLSLTLLWMVNCICPEEEIDVFSRFEGFLDDHFCWQQYGDYKGDYIDKVGVQLFQLFSLFCTYLVFAVLIFSTIKMC